MFSSNNNIAFEHFFNSYYKVVYFFACKYVQHGSVAEDIVENSFIKLWEKRGQMESEAGMRGYLYKTVYHGCLRWLENEGRRKRVEDEVKVKVENEVERDCLENMIRAETLRRVMEAMEELPSECRKVFFKLYVEGKSVAEAADELKVAASTVKSQKARGIKILRMRLTSFMVFGLSFFTHPC